MAEPWRTGAALLGGAVTLSAHGLEAGTRLAVSHPLIALAVALGLLVMAAIAAGWMLRALRRLFQRRPPRDAEVPPLA